MSRSWQMYVRLARSYCRLLYSRIFLRRTGLHGFGVHSDRFAHPSIVIILPHFGPSQLSSQYSLFPVAFVTHHSTWLYSSFIAVSLMGVLLHPCQFRRFFVIFLRAFSTQSVSDMIRWYSVQYTLFNYGHFGWLNCDNLEWSDHFQ